VRDLKCKGNRARCCGILYIRTMPWENKSRQFIKAQSPYGLSLSDDPYCKQSPPFPCSGVAEDCNILRQREQDFYCRDVIRRKLLGKLKTAELLPWK
jgi:hypothetical protein